MSQSKKPRECPAAGRVITSAECGDGRNSRYTCPVNCAFNPLSPPNYDRLLEIDSFIEKRATEWLLSRDPGCRAVRERIGRSVAADDTLAIQLFFQREFHVTRDAAGLTGFERFLRAEGAELTNDQRVVTRARMTVRLRLLEVHHILDDLQIEAMDLLDPARGTFRLWDRKMAASAARFSTTLIAVYTLPHCERVIGAGRTLVEMGGFATDDVLREVVRHLGGPVEAPAMQLWMFENAKRLYQAIRANQLAYHQAMMAATSAQVGRAVYELRTPFATARRTLDRDPEVVSDALRPNESDEGFVEARVWFDPSDAHPGSSESLRAALGRVLLGQSHWRLEAVGGGSLGRLRSAFEQQLGPAVEFRAERLDDLGEAKPASEKSPDDALIAPRLVKGARGYILASMVLPTVAVGGQSSSDIESLTSQLYLERFADTPIPGLNGRSPREAAAIPELRSPLINILKGIVRHTDERNLRTGSTDDVNWLLRELRVTELMFDPPPLRPIPPADADEDEEGGDEDEAPGNVRTENESLKRQFPEVPVDLTLPIAPRLSGALSFDEVQRRLKGLDATAIKRIDPWKELQRAGAPLTELVFDALADRLNPEEWMVFVILLMPVWSVLAPLSTRVPEFPVEMALEAYARIYDQIEEELSSGRPERMLALFERSPQHALALVGVAPLMKLHETEMAKRIRPQSIPRMMAMMLAVIEVLDHRLRD